MKVLGNLSVTKDVDVKYPFGSAIQNETDTQDGTPVVREIYNDILMNLYKLLDLTDVTPTETEDNDTTQYQIIEAIKKLPNSLNDIEQVLTLTGSVWSIPLNIDLLPNKYVLFARPTDNYVSGTVYTFKGSTGTTYSFTSQTGFNASDEVLIVIDSGTVRVYSLTMINELNQTFTVFGTPISFNDSATMHYKESGNILTDFPSIGYLENVIRVLGSDGTLILNDVFILKGKVFCVVYNPTLITYNFYTFPINDFATATLVTVSGGSIPIGVDNSPYFYTDGDSIYITNKGGSNANAYELEVYLFNETLNTITYTSLVSLENSFSRTTNAVIKSGFLYTLVGGNFKRFSLSGGTKTDIANYTGIIGNIFHFNGEVYFSSGEVAKKWTL